MRYTDLKNGIASDLSEGVLSKNLRRLTADGLVYQRSLGDHHHVWELTPKGRQMIAGLAQITHVQAGTDGSARPAADKPDHGRDGEPDAGQGRDGEHRHRRDEQASPDPADVPRPRRSLDR